MRYEQDGAFVTLPEGRYQILHVQARQSVQCSKWLIQHQKFWFPDERTRQRCTLSFSSGQGQWPCVRTMTKPHFFKNLEGSKNPLVLGLSV
ncbi:hypothetical protein AA0242T_1953 [Acetobacter aceti NRIC 0242]|nr:hypothetical protein AA0242T_1953 [Acetobacter aceti NRIC 0242]